MPVTTKVRCQCKKTLTHDVAVWIEGTPYCSECVPKPIAVTGDTPDEAAAPERRAALTEAPPEHLPAKQEATQVTVPQSVDPDDPDRGCGPVVIEEIGSQALDQKVLDDIRKTLEADLILAEQDVELLTARFAEARKAMITVKEIVDNLLAPVDQETLRVLRRLVKSALRRF